MPSNVFTCTLESYLWPKFPQHSYPVISSRGSLHHVNTLLGIWHLHLISNNNNKQNNVTAARLSLLLSNSHVRHQHIVYL